MNFPLANVVCPTAGFCAATSGSNVVISTDPAGGSSTWQATQTPVSELVSLSCPSAQLCVAGSAGASTGLVTSSDPTGGPSTWTYSNLSPYGFDVSCPNANLCVALAGPAVWVSTDPAGGASTWSETVANLGSPTGSFDSLSCPTTTFCVAVDGGGNVVTSSDPTGGSTAWSAPATIDPETTDQSGAHSLGSLSCPSASFCMAADNWGNVVYSTDPTGGISAWNLTSLSSSLDPVAGAGDSLRALSCPSSSACIGFDGLGDAVVSTDPTAGASGWTLTTPPTVPAGMSSVSCPAPDLCVAVAGISPESSIGPGAVVFSTTPAVPGSWHVVNDAIPVDVAEISCPSTTLCVVADGSDIVTSTDPTGGVGAWKTISGVDTEFEGLSDVSCPTVKLCVATGGSGTILTSKDPTGGAGAWSAPEQIPDVEVFNSVACPTTSMCVAVGTGGNLQTLPDGFVASTTEPTGGANAWRTADITPGTGGLTSVTCPSSTMCLAVNQFDIVQSTDPTAGKAGWTIGVPNTPTAAFSQAFAGLTCPTTSFCVALDNAGELGTTDEPLIEGYPWTITPDVDAPSSWNGEGGVPLACPTVDLCVEVDQDGYVVAGTAPSAGQPAVVADPTDFASVAHDAVMFSAATAGGSSVKIQWQSTSNHGATYRNITGATTSTLRFKAQASQNGDGYRALFTGHSRTVVTATATLSVKPPQIPHMTSHFTAKLLSGKPGIFVLHAVGVPTPLLTESGEVPSGLNFKNIGDGYALLWGTPAKSVAGKFRLTIVAKNVVGSSAKQSFVLTIVKP